MWCHGRWLLLLFLFLMLCATCGMTFQSSNELLQHESTVHNAFKCNVCSKTYQHRKNLLRHIRDSHPTVAVSVQKPRYRKKLSVSVEECDMSVHTDKTKVLEVVSKTCDEIETVNIEASTRASDNHVKERDMCVHNDKNITSQDFTETGDEIETVNTLASTKANVHTCHICDKQFNVLSNLNRHLKTHDEFKSFRCSLCKEKFARPDNLKRHMESIHDHKECKESEFKCSSCSKSYNHKKNLLRHVRECHVDTNSVTATSNHPEDTVCMLCDESFHNRKSLLSHIREEHCDVISDVEDDCSDSEENTSHKLRKIQCVHCNSTFSNKNNLLRHQKQKHQSLYVPSDSAAKVACPGCEATLHNHKSLVGHLAEVHSYHAEKEEISVDSFEGLESVHPRGKTLLFCETGKCKNVAQGQRFYFMCHRSGFFPPRGTENRMRRIKTVKINAVCPAKMIVTRTETTVNVSFYPNHFGHESSIAFLKLTEAERHILANKLRQGASFEKILDDIRDQVFDQECITRLSLTERRDLWNILRGLGLKRNRAHQNDALSVDIIVESLKKLGNDNPIRFFKPQGQSCSDPRFSFDDDDFMIVVSTPYQHSVLSQYLKKRVLVDSTHGTNSYGLSNRIDKDAMTVFFTVIKDTLKEKVATEAFMSDCADQYYNAWCAVMGESEYRLYCSWHVDRSWRNNLKKVNNQEQQLDVYRACRVLLTMADKELFMICLQGFVQMLLGDEDTKEFGHYFESNYARRPELWAYCFRAGLGLNTNMFLEALHKKLKYMYMHGKQIRRVDECLSILLRFTRDISFERLIRHCKGNNSYRQSSVNASHKLSLKITSTGKMYFDLDKIPNSKPFWEIEGGGVLSAF